MIDPDLTDADYIHAAYADAIVEGIPLDRLIEIYNETADPREFFEGVQAAVELKQIVEEHYAATPDRRC